MFPLFGAGLKNFKKAGIIRKKKKQEMGFNF
jgi:hypothetical protein